MIGRKHKGVFLVELVVAVLVAASTSMAIFSVILSSSVSQKRAEKRQRAAMVLKRAQESLKSYVTVETGGTFFGAVTPGPSWQLPGDAMAWALTGGVHDITSWISSDLVLCPTGGSPSCRFTYTVTNDGSCSPFGTADNLACKRVVFDLRYSD